MTSCSTKVEFTPRLIAAITKVDMLSVSLDTRTTTGLSETHGEDHGENRVISESKRDSAEQVCARCTPEVLTPSGKTSRFTLIVIRSNIHLDYQ